MGAEPPSFHQFWAVMTSDDEIWVLTHDDDDDGDNAFSYRGDAYGCIGYLVDYIGYLTWVDGCRNEDEGRFQRCVVAAVEESIMADEGATAVAA